MIGAAGLLHVYHTQVHVTVTVIVTVIVIVIVIVMVKATNRHFAADSDACM